MGFSYAELLSLLHKGLRNGGWKRLDRVEKAFYRATLCYAKLKGEILNPKLTSLLLSIAGKLRETLNLKIFRAGLARAQRMVEALKAGAYPWCPNLKNWLKNPKYIFWLGLNTLSSPLTKPR